MSTAVQHYRNCYIQKEKFEDTISHSNYTRGFLPLLYSPCEQSQSAKLNQIKAVVSTFGISRYDFYNGFLSISAGQTVCRGGTQRPCYKTVYFHDASRRVTYEEAHFYCRADGGHLVSIETEAEQGLIQKFIESLMASDGDFWIGLRRKKAEVDNSTDCQNLYSWSDGSSSKFRQVPGSATDRAASWSGIVTCLQQSRRVLSKESSDFVPAVMYVPPVVTEEWSYLQRAVHPIQVIQ